MPLKFLWSHHHGKEASGFMNLTLRGAGVNDMDTDVLCHTSPSFKLSSTATLAHRENHIPQSAYLPPYPSCSHCHCHCLWVDNRYKIHGLGCCCYLLEYTTEKGEETGLTRDRRSHHGSRGWWTELLSQSGVSKFTEGAWQILLMILPKAFWGML